MIVALIRQNFLRETLVQNHSAQYFNVHPDAVLNFGEVNVFVGRMRPG
jgi:hypothetical protein